MTISGKTTEVTATGGSANSSVSRPRSVGIYGREGVDISGGTVTATGGGPADGTTANCSIGIYASDGSADGGVTISGGTVTATAGEVKGSATNCISYGINAVYITISGGTVTATGGKADYGSYGIFSLRPVGSPYPTSNISGGHVTARTLADESATTRMALNQAPTLSGSDYSWRASEEDPFTTGTEDSYDYDAAHTYVEFFFPKPISGCTVDPIPNQSYADGTPLTPAVTVRDGDVTLTEDTDYTVSYKNNVDAGTATVTITGKGDYTGETSATFTILQADPIPPTGLTGVEGQDLSTVELPSGWSWVSGDQTLIIGQTYLAYYSGSANYSSGYTYLTVTLQPKPVDTTTMTVTQEGCTYGETLPDYALSGKPAFSSETVLYTGTLAKDNSDYSSAEKPTEAGAYTVKVTCGTKEKNYEASASFTIAPRSIEGLAVTLSDTELAYTGDSRSVTVTKVGNLAAGDYEASGTSGTNAGEYTVTVTGKGNYTGAATAPWRITQKALTISGAAAVDRDYAEGSKLVDISAVRFGNAALTIGTDYTAAGTMDDDTAGSGKQVHVSVTLINPNYTLDNGETETTVTIRKIDPAVPIGLTGVAGRTLATVPLPDSWWWDDPSAILDAGGTFQASYTDKTGNYNDVSGVDVAVTVIEGYTVTAAGLYGGTMGKPGETYTGTYAAGELVSLQVGIRDGYKPKGVTLTGITEDDLIWAGKDSEEYAVRGFTFIMPENDVMITVNWEKLSGSTGASAYAVTVDRARNGDVTSSHETASKGTTVTLTVEPDKGYTLEALTVTDAGGKKVTVTEKNGKYTFTMPASRVTVKATFMEDNSMLNFFVDVPANAYYYDAVLWAAENGITGGTDAVHFSPNASCTRAQAVTFLWRAAGSPAPKSSEMPFTDVAKGSYYYNAVLWAIEQGITKGTGDTTFSPNAACTRAQIVTFLWRAQGSPAAGAVNPFTDVAADAYYAGAVQWAVANGVTDGTSATTFSPDADCTRAQIVTFLYRCLG